mgnify:CR=1 FL=1
MRLGCIRNINPEHGAKCGNHNAVTFLINMNDGTVEALLFGEAGVSHETEEDKSEEASEKGRTHIRPNEHSRV